MLQEVSIFNTMCVYSFIGLYTSGNRFFILLLAFGACTQSHVRSVGLHAPRQIIHVLEGFRVKTTGPDKCSNIEKSVPDTSLHT